MSSSRARGGRGRGGARAQSFSPATATTTSSSNLTEDARFKHVHIDPRFSRRRANATKEFSVDSRFTHMFDDPNFTVKYRVDAYGRPVAGPGDSSNKSKTGKSDNPLKKFYKVDDEKKDVGDDASDSGDDGSGDDTEVGKSYLSSRQMAPPSSDDESGAEDDEGDDDSDDITKAIYRGIETPLADTSSDDDDVDESAIEMLVDDEDDSAETIEMGEPSSRLALLNLDWDRLRSIDLYVLVRSFLTNAHTPTSNDSGSAHAFTPESLKRVSIYPSEFGKARMAEESRYGPIGLYQGTAEQYRDSVEAKINDTHTDDTTEKDNVNESDSGNVSANPAANDTDGFLDQDKLRVYELSRLKYYYAIVELDSTPAAQHIYTELDGLEYESSANKLDLRFVPDSVTFNDEPRDECDGLTATELSAYTAPMFATRALQSSKVELTWDADEPQRKKVMHAKKGTINDDDLAVYLASDDEADGYGSDAVTDAEDDVDIDEEPVKLKRKARAKYKSLLAELATTGDDNGDDSQGEEDGEDESSTVKNDSEDGFTITFEPGLKAKGEELARKALEFASAANETVFEKQMKQIKEKHRAKRIAKRAGDAETATDDGNGNESEGSVPEGVDMSDDFFKGAFDDDDYLPANDSDGADAAAKATRKAREFFSDDARPKNKFTRKNDRRSEGDRDQSLELLVDDDDDSKGYSLKQLVKDHRQSTKSKGKSQPKGEDFNVDVSDPRFTVMYENPSYSIDPTHPEFKATAGMEKLQSERQQRRIQQQTQFESQIKQQKKKKKSAHDEAHADTDSGSAGGGGDSNLSALIQSVKSKAKVNERAQSKPQSHLSKRDRAPQSDSLQHGNKRARFEQTTGAREDRH